MHRFPLDEIVLGKANGCAFLLRIQSRFALLPLLLRRFLKLSFSIDRTIGNDRPASAFQAISSSQRAEPANVINADIPWSPTNDASLRSHFMLENEKGVRE